MERFEAFIKGIVNWLRTDGICHLSVSAVLTLFFGSFLPLFIAIILTLTIGVVKEIIWDDKMGNGLAEMHDIECDVIGIVIGSLIYLLYLI